MPPFWRRAEPPAPIAPSPSPLTLAEITARDQRDRTTKAMGLIDAALNQQSDHWPEDRNVELVDLCLEVRAALLPPDVGIQRRAISSTHRGAHTA